MNEQNNQMQPITPQATSGDSITFDYNQLYSNQLTQNKPQMATETEDTTASILQETPIVFEEEKKAEPEIVKNVIPTFDTRALEDNPDDENIDEKLIHTIKPESQQENAQYKKNLLFILVFFSVLIIAVWFIFPLLAGY